MDKLFAGLFKVGFTVGLGVLTSFYWGWAFMTLWGWFAVIGSGMPTLAYPFWVGVSFMLGQLATAWMSLEDVEKDDNGWGVTVAWSIAKIVLSLVGLGIAWLAFLLLL